MLRGRLWAQRGPTPILASLAMALVASQKKFAKCRLSMAQVGSDGLQAAMHR